MNGRAQALIMAGKVLVDGQCGINPAWRCGGALVELKSESPYVSRGGLKLEAAVEAFGIRALGKVCADAGASTGGFTDLLAAGGSDSGFMPLIRPPASWRGKSARIRGWS